jgi:putative endopeptidase
MSKIKTLSIIALSTISVGCSLTKDKSGKVAEDISAKTGTYASIHQEYMDISVRPQDDFFEFANGTWVKNNPVPPSESRWGSFNELDKSNKEKLTKILEKATTEKGEKGSQNQILGDYYSSFINMELRNKLGSNGIQTDLDRVINIKSKDELVSVLAESHMNGVRALFSFGVGQDLKDVDNNITYIGQGGIGLPNNTYYLKKDKEKELAAYKKHVGEIFKLMNYTEAEAQNKATSVVEFETSLAKVMMEPQELRIPEKTYHKMEKGQVEKTFGKFDFDRYLSLVGSKSFDSIVVSQPLFIENVSVLIDQVSLIDWKNYLLWCNINHYAGHLNQAFVDQDFAFYGTVLSGKTEMKPLNERAIDEITRQEFGEMLGKAFVEKYYSEKAQQRVNSMVDNLLVVFQDRIENLDWMSKETKEQALLKLNSIGRKLGFPSKWEDFSSLNFSKDEYIANIKATSLYDHTENMKKLSEPVDKEKWGMPAHMVNAYYHPLLNEIAFPAGIMQPPFFDENVEDAVNYGSIGMVIGHEFTHGFDDMGSKFAADGTFTNWWTKSDREAFEEKTKKLGETYAAFCPIDGYCVNPDLTMGENIADLGGLTLSYYAYTLTNEFKSGIKRNGYTPAQRFFIGYAQLWKINYTEEEMKNRIANDPHSPGMYRVNGPLKNCPEFFEAFDVKDGDKMKNGENKISKIW